MGNRGRSAALVLAMMAAGACDACEGKETRVPFKSREGASTDPGKSSGPGSPEDGASETGTSAAAADGGDSTSKRGRTLPEGTRRVAIEGAPLKVREGALRALLALDVDDDGDRDALVVHAGKDGRVWVRFGRREGPRFAGLSRLAVLAKAGRDCELRRASLRRVSSRLVVGTLRRRCAEGAERSMAIIGLGAQPRTREVVALLPPEGRVPGKVTVALHPRDEDGDGYEDIVLDVKVTPPQRQESAEVKLVWLDRPAGLARDPEQPEKRIGELAQRAHETLESDPKQAIALARTALAMHGVLCEEGEGPRLRFGDSLGLACGTSAGAGHAAAIAAAARVRNGELFAGLDATDRLERSAYEVSEAQRNLVRDAWKQAPTPDGLTWRHVAQHARPRQPDVRLSAIALLDSSTLLLRGDRARVITLDAKDGGGTTTKSASDGERSLLVRDPARRFAVVDLVRDCDGYRLEIVRAEDVVAGVVAGQPVSRPLVMRRAPPAGSQCPEGPLPQAARDDHGGWRVLGWAPQGVVAVRHDQVRVVPLNVEGKPAGDPSSLEPGTPPPAPLPHGAVTPDGNAYVVGTRFGVLLRRLGASETVLLRPDGWYDAEGEVGDATISPDATRVAVMRGRKVWLIEGVESN